MTAHERATAFYRGLASLGYSVFTGVPCSLLEGLYHAVEGARGTYYPATREDLAVGLAAGFTLAGHRSAVLMQNSGLTVSINALLSLVALYELPVLLVVSWRGEGPDAPEHLATGRAMLPLLHTLGIPYRMATAPDALAEDFHRQAGPVALIVRKGDFS